jgi:hypothetical protein
MHFTCRPVYILIVPRWIVVRMRNVSDKISRGNQNTHFMCNNFFLKNHALYEIMWKKYDRAGQVRDDNIIRRVLFWRWITEATNTHTQNMKDFVLFHGSSGYTNVPRYCFMYVVGLVLSVFSTFELTFRHPSFSVPVWLWCSLKIAITFRNNNQLSVLKKRGAQSPTS